MFQRVALRRIISVSCTLLIVLLSCVGVFASSDDIRVDTSFPEIREDEEVSVTIKASPVTPSNTSGFHNVIITLLGNYEPITVDYTYQSGTNYQNTSHSITTAPDWSWICSAAIFAIIIFCLFRLIGGLFSWKR